MSLQKLAENRCFGGQQLRFSHSSTSLSCDMNFSIYLPPQAESGPVPVIYWLSGLTCTDENFVQKAGAQRYAAEYGVAIVAPDTSPRGEGVADDPEGSWDFGLGAGFYLNATQAPYNQHYRMYDYITTELPELIADNFPVDANRVSIMGHSMGGHGALTIALKNPSVYASVSAFSPICNPMNCPWGRKAFRNYLGDDTNTWIDQDTCELVLGSKGSNERKHTLLVDQGTGDDFLIEQLKPEALSQACMVADHPLDLRMREGYDHSYFFIASFIGEHIAHHAKHLFD